LLSATSAPLGASYVKETGVIEGGVETENPFRVPFSLARSAYNFRPFYGRKKVVLGFLYGLFWHFLAFLLSKKLFFVF